MYPDGDASAPIDANQEDFARAVRVNQQRLRTGLKPSYDFIVCGSGSSGSVVARRLAENPDATILLLEAGGWDEAAAVTDPLSWPANLGSERDWAFQTRPSPHLNGRSLLWSMGKVLGGGSSINAMIWSRGHRNDWDRFAAETGDTGWSYENVLDIYRRIEDWQGEPDPARRGVGGLVSVQPAPDPNPVAPTMLESARFLGIPTFADQNGSMMEGEGGCALANLRTRDGKRLSVFRTYAYPCMDQPNLTVLTAALVTRVVFKGRRAVGVDVVLDGETRRFGAGCEVVLSLGAIHTPKVLMQSGIGDEEELGRFGIEVVQHLPGVGRNLQEHALLAGCVWEYDRPLAPRNNACEATLFWKSDPGLAAPDMQILQAELALFSPEAAARLEAPPADGWSMLPSVVRPQSRGRLRLTGANPSDPLDIEAGVLAEPADLKAMMTCVELCREIGNSAAFRSLVKREVVPGDLRGPALEGFVRDAIVPYWHQTCTAKMGRDHMAVVDGTLQVHGVDGLRIADGSVLPRVTTGNTMAPCVIVGERAAAVIRKSQAS